MHTPDPIQFNGLRTVTHPMAMLGVMLQQPMAMEPTHFERLCQAMRDASSAWVVTAATTPGHAPTAAQPPRDKIGIFEPSRNAMRIIGGVALIEIVGPMFPTKTRFGEVFGETGMDEVEREVEQATADGSVNAILMLIDSPGGTVAGTESLGRAVAAAKAVKPVLVFSPNVLASAAYWVASQAGRILVGANCAAGSIGVRGPTLFDYTGMLDQMGLKAYPIASSAIKRTGGIGPVTEEQVADQQRIVDEMHANFRAAVQAGRGFTAQQLDAVADARIHVGPQAVAMKLADGLATFDEAMHEARQSAQRHVQRQSPAATSQLSTEPIAAGTVPSAGPAQAPADVSAGAAAADSRKDPIMPQTHSAAPVNTQASAPQTTPATAPASSTFAATSTPAPAAAPTPATPATAAAAAAGEPKPATIAELRAAFPADPAFALEAAEKAFTLTEAKAAYSDVLSARLASLEQQQATQQAAQQAPAAQAQARKPGVPAVQTQARASAAREASGDPIEDFNAAVAEKMATNGGNRKAAIASVCRVNPELHQAYLVATNPKGVHAKIADRFTDAA